MNKGIAQNYVTMCTHMQLHAGSDSLAPILNLTEETYSLQGCGDPHGRLHQKDLTPLDLALDARERYSSRGQTRSSRIMVDIVLPTLDLQFWSEDT